MDQRKLMDNANTITDMAKVIEVNRVSRCTLLIFFCFVNIINTGEPLLFAVLISIVFIIFGENKGEIKMGKKTVNIKQAHKALF